jgi:hypothetical protein
MKQIFTFLSCSLFSLSLLANDGSTLNISRINSNINLRIEIDGQAVKLDRNSITLNNLCEGNHNVRVYREVFRNSFGQGFQIIYATTVYLGSNYQVDIAINGSGKVSLDSYRFDPENDYYYNNCGNGNNGENGNICKSR